MDTLTQLTDLPWKALTWPFASELHQEGKPLPKTLFLDIMVEKTQKLIEHIKNDQLGLSLTANIHENSASIKMYDNYATTNSQLLHITITNIWDLENQLWRSWIEVNRVFYMTSSLHWSFITTANPSTILPHGTICVSFNYVKPCIYIYENIKNIHYLYIILIARCL